MIPRERLASARIRGGGEMILYRRGDDHMILVDREELMSSRMSGSEEALATMTLARLQTAAPHILIGGYGMGFTLRAALGALSLAGAVTIAELVPEIVEWARGPMATMTGGSLDDPRVTIRIGDVADVIAEGRGTFDAILLDVDNGPDGLVRVGNNRLYSPGGLAAARSALRPAGVMTVWSAAPDPAFTKRLSAAGFRVEEETVRARSNGKGPRHHLWFATA